MSSLRAVQGVRVLASRLGSRTTPLVTTASYSTNRHHNRKEYRRQKSEKSDRRLPTMAAGLAVAAVGVSLQKKKSIEDITNQEILDEENRIRQLWSPDKVFHYFASYQVVDKKGNKTIMMTPLDVYSAITPNCSLSHGSGGGVYTQVDAESFPVYFTPAPDPDNTSVLNAIGRMGLFSYSDFCVLLTILSTPKRYIDTAFQVFDVTGEGSICAKEFAYVSTHMAFKIGGFGEYTDVDQAEVLSSNSGLLNYLFGTDRQGGVTQQQFQDLQTALLDEIIKLEFYEMDKENTGRISEVDFCKWLLQNAKLTSKKKKDMMKKIEQRWPTQGRGISFPSFKNIYHVLAGGADLQRALFYFDVEAIGIDIDEFKKIASWISKVEPSPHCSEVMFLLLDANQDGRLYQDTLGPVLFEWRNSRGLNKGLSIAMGQTKV